MEPSSRSIAIVRRGRSRPGRSSSPAERRYAGTEIPRLVLKKLREKGASATIARLLTVRGFRRVDVYLLEREKVLSAPAVPGIDVRALAEAEVRAHAELRPDVTEPALIARIRTGDCCMGAWREGRLVGSRWVAAVSADLPDLEISAPICPGVAYAYDAFTVQEERGRGIAAMITAALFEHAERNGASHVINAVLPENPLGQGLARARSKPIGMLRSGRLGRWVIVLSLLPGGFLGPPLPLWTRPTGRS